MYCVLDNDVYRAHFNWAVWGEQEFVRWKGTEISCRRDRQKCITGHPRNMDHGFVAPAWGGAGRVRTEVGGLQGGAPDGLATLQALFLPCQQSAAY